MTYTRNIAAQLKEVENDFTRKIYNQILLLAILIHCYYAGLFYYFHIHELTYYNFFSVLFYSFILFIAKKRKYRILVALTHLEVFVFAAYTTILVGWACGFSLFFVCMSTLVYLCPYKRKFIPYIFSLIEIIGFITMRLYTNAYISPYSYQMTDHVNFLYVINSLSSFGVIIYCSFLTNLSSDITKEELINENSNLVYLANHDYLTGLMTRRGAISILEDLYKDYKVHKTPFTIVMGDIDNFKDINDTYGHACGDYVLRIISELFIEATEGRKIDVVRWGGEEFVIIFHGESIDSIIHFINHLHHEISSYPFKYDHIDFHLTMTFGVCDTKNMHGVEAMLKRADDLLYKGKNRSKNIVITS